MLQIRTIPGVATASAAAGWLLNHVTVVGFLLYSTVLWLNGGPGSSSQLG